MSAIYESNTDRRNEHGFAGWLENRYPELLVQVTTTIEPYDLLIAKSGSLYALAEYKRRRCHSSLYATLTIYRLKVDRLHREALERGVRALVFIEWDDGPGVLTLNHTRYRTGRQTLREVRDRNDVDDEVYHLPIKEFLLL